jgi:poly(3-hydroxybutyrate) depolymerase
MKTYSRLDIAKQIEPEKTKQNAMKQKVSRYIKENRIKEVKTVSQKQHYDETVAIEIIKHFSEINRLKKPTHDQINESVFDTLLKQLEIKDKQIADLTEQNKALLFKTMSRKEKKLLYLNSGNQENKRWWEFWKNSTRM